LKPAAAHTPEPAKRLEHGPDRPSTDERSYVCSGTGTVLLDLFGELVEVKASTGASPPPIACCPVGFTKLRALLVPYSNDCKELGMIALRFSPMQR